MDLSSNSKEMATVVETFVIEEVASLIYDGEKLDRWNELVSKMGLEGQTKIVNRDKSPIPFLPLNSGLKNVFKTLCPTSVDIENYNVSPIPVEILDLVSLSIQEGYFQKIEVWYDEKSKDPAVIGTSGFYYQSTWDSSRNPEFDNVHFNSKSDAYFAGVNPKTSIYFNEKNSYLIGKWSDMKHSFEELRKMATVRFKKEQEVELQETIKKAKRSLEDLDATAFNKFN